MVTISEHLKVIGKKNEGNIVLSMVTMSENLVKKRRKYCVNKDWHRWMWWKDTDTQMGDGKPQ